MPITLGDDGRVRRLRTYALGGVSVAMLLDPQLGKKQLLRPITRDHLAPSNAERFS